MNSIDFLKEKLTTLHNAHPYLEIKYEYVNYINTHIVEVKPIHCFESDKLYISQQIKLEDMFEEIYPNEEIVFITENILIQIENPLLKLGISDISVDENITEFFKCQPIYEFLDSGLSINEVILDPTNTYNSNKTWQNSYFKPPLIINKAENKKDSKNCFESFFLFNIAL